MTAGAGVVETVVKVGGGLLTHAVSFDSALAAIAASRQRRLLVVPGGGPLADAVRALDLRLSLPDNAAHWMAVLAMDQCAHVVASRLAGAVLVEAPHEIGGVIDAGGVPVLAPSRWLRAVDPLPHAWTVTSDSIAAWVAGQIGARRLVLVKPPGAAGCDLVDVYFTRALPAHVIPVVVPADRTDALYSALQGESEPA